MLLIHFQKNYIKGALDERKSISSLRRGRPKDPRAEVPAVWNVFNVSYVAGSEIE